MRESVGCGGRGLNVERGRSSSASFIGILERDLKSGQWTGLSRVKILRHCSEVRRGRGSPRLCFMPHASAAGTESTERPSLSQM